MSPLDLHVLGTPPAFVLSQDQTLVFNPSHLSMQNSLESSLSLPLPRIPPKEVLFLARFSLCIVFKVRLRSISCAVHGTLAFSRCVRDSSSGALSDPLASELA